MTPRKSASPVTADDLPHLHAFLAGYLHQDFLVDHTTPAGALAAFLRDASADERRALGSDWRAFLVAAEGLSWTEERALFASLGGSWSPATRTVLRRLFGRLR